MKIYSMTATFGKLENKTLTLEPGLNVIHAPNEWGKSTWCAFIVAMLYGIDTRERNTQTTIADKEHYKPWSGSPMSGRMDICWNGRDITIERSTKGRAIMGQFNAYETATGLPVTELTAENCGEMLLGVEKSVFVRSGFIRMTDMPVTNDESLRRRLNALVTTGDESGASDDLAQKLKELKNSCRHNKTGALPQAENKRAEITDKLAQLENLQLLQENILNSKKSLQGQLKDLQNHQQALAYAAEEFNQRRIQAAQEARDTAARVMQEAATHCENLPTEETANNALQQLKGLQQQWNTMQAEIPPQMPEPVQTPAPFIGMDGSQAVQIAKSDYSALQMLTKPLSPALLIAAAVSFLVGIVLAFVLWYAAIPFGLIGAMLLIMQQNNKKKQLHDREAVCSRYGGLPPESWIPLAESYCQKADSYAREYALYKQQLQAQQERREALTQQTAALTQGQPLAAAMVSWENILTRYEELEEARQKWKQESEHAAALASMAKPVEKPAYPDQLTLNAEQTQVALKNIEAELNTLERRLGQYQAQMEHLGSLDVLQQQLAQVQQRIEKLEAIYHAVVLAQETLSQAADTLQRRFAPKITAAARDLFEKLTAGRYDRLVLGQDLSVTTGAEGETTLHTAQWRSDGTADQLYLALRLAVSGELTPNAPLVLDDALVRFDDDRLALAMEILQAEAEKKQVILFTCQSRELSWKS